MRQGHQNRRSRGRHNNNRKGQNPLTRSFESNGPDVKIRGTPAHIAEKYMSLARDAVASDDPVLAENYLQHAEHYNRIIMAYREQQVQQSGEMVNGGGRFGQDEDFGEDGDEDFGDSMPGGAQQVRGYEQQPNVGGNSRYEGGERGERYEQRDQRDQRDREHRGDQRDQRGGHRYDDRQRRHENRPRRDRSDYRNGNGNGNGNNEAVRQPESGFAGGPEHAPPQPDVGDAPLNGANGAHAEAPARAERPARVDRPERPERSENAPRRRRERFEGDVDQQPAFLRRPVRRPRSEPVADGGEDTVVAADPPGGSDDGAND